MEGGDTNLTCKGVQHQAHIQTMGWLRRSVSSSSNIVRVMRRVNNNCNQGGHRSATPMGISPQATILASHLHQNWSPNPVLPMNPPTGSSLDQTPAAPVGILGDTQGAPAHNGNWVNTY